MTKRGVKTCDRCKGEMNLKETRPAEAGIYNFISLGWKNERGRTTNKNLDLCPDCMDELNEFLSGKS